MLTDPQNNRRSLKNLRDAIRDYYVKYQNVPEVIAVTDQFYQQILSDRLDFAGGSTDAMEQVTYQNCKIYKAYDFEIEANFKFMTLADFNYMKKRHVMFHRLITNGEWLAEGNSDREACIRDEAEGFAEMCAGFDQWERMVKDYLNIYPKPPEK